MSVRKAKIAYYTFMFAGVVALGFATPWLKSLGTAVYVGLSFLYLLMLASIGHQIFNRLKLK